MARVRGRDEHSIMFERGRLTGRRARTAGTDVFAFARRRETWIGSTQLSSGARKSFRSSVLNLSPAEKPVLAAVARPRESMRPCGGEGGPARHAGEQA